MSAPAPAPATAPGHQQGHGHGGVSSGMIITLTILALLMVGVFAYIYGVPQGTTSSGGQPQIQVTLSDAQIGQIVDAVVSKLSEDSTSLPAGSLQLVLDGIKGQMAELTKAHASLTPQTIAESVWAMPINGIPYISPDGKGERLVFLGVNPEDGEVDWASELKQ
jgi:hypothetical protein